MKKKYLVIRIIFFLIMIFIGSSIIGDVLYLIIKDKINRIFFYILHVILTFIMIEVLLKIKIGKDLKKDIDLLIKKKEKKSKNKK